MRRGVSIGVGGAVSCHRLGLVPWAHGLVLGLALLFITLDLD